VPTYSIARFCDMLHSLPCCGRLIFLIVEEKLGHTGFRHRGSPGLVERFDLNAR